MSRPFVLPLKQAAMQLFARSLETSMAGIHFTLFPFIAGHRAGVRIWVPHGFATGLLFRPVRGNVVTVPRLGLRWAGLRFFGGASYD
jgi:hypothetical protein